MALVLGLIVNAVALWVATLIVPGITLHETGGIYAPGGGAIDNEVSVPTIAALLIVAVVFALVNAVIKPVVQLLSLPLTILTLGLFLLVVNALMLMLTGWITTTFQPFGAEFVVSGFWAAFFGAIVVGLVNWVLGMLIPTRARA
ncbi:phage holin family protein [Dietzia sp. ANT_WB102]|uniref:phage holin family protein n=1 Tax=Dietzia sp. ANT_WB102 TaxID=2597345 RepID=UPI0011EDAE9C|nr:phage holin family protein [Dietzia sp. ANT_WB102]KAA0918039.1 phage holin family protein [Dietzia sp. ANT_WB102]